MAAAEILLAAFAFLFIAWCSVAARKKAPITNWPVLGMLPGIISNSSRIHDYFTHLLQQSNRTTSLKGLYGSEMFILTSDPRNVRYILSTRFANFTKGEAFREIFELWGDGIVAAESDSWKMQRKLTRSLFTQREFVTLVETATQRKVRDGLFEILDRASESCRVVDVQDLFVRLMFDVTCVSVLGTDLEFLSADLPEVPFSTALDDLDEVILRRFLMPRSLWRLQRWLQIGGEKKAVTASKTLDDFINHQISLKQELKSKKAGEGFDLISVFTGDEVVAKCKLANKPVDKFIRDEVMSVLAAGRGTSNITLTWFLRLVYTNPSVESKIIEELRVAFRMNEGDPWRFPSFTDLNKLIYLHGALCETLRLYPAVPFNHKATVEPDTLPSGHRVRSRTRIIISMYAMGRMEEIWGADCCEFRPERWISEKGSVIDVPSYKLNSFSAGPRTCAGKDLSIIEMKTVAAAIIWSYHIRVSECHRPVPVNATVLRMQDGLKVNVSRRGTSNN